MNPRFPIYIVSKGRWETRYTSKAFEHMGVPYRIIVEEQERDSYAAVIDPAKILVLDPKFKSDYDVFSALGTEGTGSGPARNFAWEHSLSEGHEWHWTVDDNIDHFGRLTNGFSNPVKDGTIFRCMEDFVLRYKNVGMAGPNYRYFPRTKLKPFYINDRIYSCNLIRGSLPIRWRGRYNEDTDLTLRILKAGWCTVLFNAFYQDKMPTLTMKGGNTDTIYTKGTYPKSQMLVDMHPDCCKLVWRFGRAHHFVDYKRFKHGLAREETATFGSGIDEYGMKLVDVPKEQRSRANRQKAGAKCTTESNGELKPKSVVKNDGGAPRPKKKRAASTSASKSSSRTSGAPRSGSTA